MKFSVFQLLAKEQNTFQFKQLSAWTNLKDIREEPHLKKIKEKWSRFILNDAI